MNRLYKELLAALEKDDVERRTYVDSGIEELYQCGKLIYKTGQGSGEYITETIKPEPELVLFGAGHVSLALYTLAMLQGMKCVVIDERVEVCNKDRFPNATLITDKYEDTLEKDLGFFRPYYVIFTHGHKYDNKCLRYSLRHNSSYIGMIGSKGKVAQTFADLKKDGFTDDEISKVYSPIGLSIGAVTPEEIAISIMAEIISVFRSTKDTITLAPEYLRKVEDEKGIVVRIIEKRGSAPRAVGSEIFVTEKGDYGTIGGGAIEKIAIEEANQMLKENTPTRIKAYNLSSKGDLGMICGGDVTLLFHRVG